MKTMCPKCGGVGSWLELHDGTPVLRHSCGFWGPGMSTIEAAAKSYRQGAADALESQRRKMEAEIAEIKAKDIEGACAWSLCSDRARDNSKYCSRDCSNKNARARHRERLLSA